jgi:hypothetical protein
MRTSSRDAPEISQEPDIFFSMRSIDVNSQAICRANGPAGSRDIGNANKRRLTKKQNFASEVYFQMSRARDTKT